MSRTNFGEWNVERTAHKGVVFISADHIRNVQDLSIGKLPLGMGTCT